MTRPAPESVDGTRATPARPTRRSTLKLAAGALAGASLPRFAIAQSRPIKIGYITALSGVRAAFGEADQWQLEKVRALLKSGITVGGKQHAVEIVLKDNQSDPNRSLTVSNDLVLRDKVDLVLVQDGDAAGPAGQLCVETGIPLLSTMMPWQAFVFGRNSTPDKGFPFSFHFFWGAEDTMKNFVGMWDSVKTNKTVGALFIDNPPGKAFADPNTGMPAALKAGGYKEINTGFFKIATDDFSNQVSALKTGNAQIASGFMFGNHIATFWKQAQQAGYRPEVCTMAAAFLFPSALEALGDAGDGMSTEVWWTPSFPFKSSLTGQSAAELAGEWEKSTGRQWTQPIGYAHALWETAIGALKGAADPRDRKAVRAAIANMALDTVVGKVDFKNSKIKSVAQTPLVGGQWRRTKSGKHPYELHVVQNATAKFIPTTAEMKALSALK